jgi:hypothetical protein
VVATIKQLKINYLQLDVESLLFVDKVVVRIQNGCKWTMWLEVG